MLMRVDEEWRHGGGVRHRPEVRCDDCGEYGGLRIRVGGAIVGIIEDGSERAVRGEEHDVTGRVTGSVRAMTPRGLLMRGAAESEAVPGGSTGPHSQGGLERPSKELQIFRSEACSHWR